MTVTKADIVSLAAELLTLAAPALAKREPQGLRTFRSDLERLVRESTAAPHFNVCFLGNAAVGKTSLINAVVDPACPLLPQGGIGPLTATETRVVHGEEPRLDAEFIPASSVQSWLNTLEAVDRESSAPNVEVALANQARRLLRLAFCGQQAGAQQDEYLKEAARRALGQAPQVGFLLAEDDDERVRRARACLSERRGSTGYFQDRGAFLRDIEAQATGALAPLVRSLLVAWPSDALPAGLTLIDLPGLGVANDAYQVVTRNYLMDEASIVVLAVDKSGIVEDVATALQNTGFFRRLLLGINDDTKGLGVLTVAVSKLDLVASDARRADKRFTWSRHLSTLSERAVHVIRHQLRVQLDVAARQLGEKTTDRKERINRTLKAIHVLPLLPTEAQRLAVADPEHRPLVSTAGETGLPEFIERLHLSFRRAAELDQEQFLARVEDFQGRVTSAVHRCRRHHNERELPEGE